MGLKPGIKLLWESVGSGPRVSRGDVVTVRLNGTLNRGDAIQEDYVGEIVVGSRAVIPGIEGSLEGMRQGGRRRVKISPHLGYGDEGVKDLVPADAVLVYEIEVLDVRRS